MGVSGKREPMDKEREQTESEPLTEEELEEADGEPLPDREVMTILPIEPTGPGIEPPPLESS